MCCRELTSRPAHHSCQQHVDDEDRDDVDLDDDDEDDGGLFNEDDEGLYHQQQTLSAPLHPLSAQLSLRILGEHTDLAETKRKPVMSEP